jgi:hypothetical protein
MLGIDNYFLSKLFMICGVCYQTNKANIANALLCLIRLPGLEAETSIAVLARGLENFEITKMIP